MSLINLITEAVSIDQVKQTLENFDVEVVDSINVGDYEMILSTDQRSDMIIRHLSKGVYLKGYQIMFRHTDKNLSPDDIMSDTGADSFNIPYSEFPKLISKFNEWREDYLGKSKCILIGSNNERKARFWISILKRYKIEHEILSYGDYKIALVKES